MSLQNRVDAWGEICAVPDRGGWMGNRGGRIHKSDRTLGSRRWAGKYWIYCALSFRGRHREVMGARTYTELFFMDEVTALAAGHRPCWECQNKRAKEFLSAAGGYRAPELDEIVHVERTGARVVGVVKDLPDGAMFEVDGAALTQWRGEVLAWSWQGFSRFDGKVEGAVRVLTPASYVVALREGFVPELKFVV